MAMLDRVYVRKDKVVARRVADEMLLVPIRGTLTDMQRLYVPEGAGEFIWDLIDGNRDLSGILNEIVSVFDIEAGDAERDLLEFIRALEDASLIAEADTI